MKRNRSRRRGVTLVEIAVAILLVAMAVMVFGASVPASSQSTLKARSSDLATDACQRQLEYWRYVGYASLPAFPTGSSTMTQSFAAPSELQRPTAQVIFTRVDGSFASTTTDTGLVRMDATVTWTGVRSNRGTVTLSSLLHR